MRLGIHAPKQGATAAFQETVLRAKLDMIVWTISEGPQDLGLFPDAFNVLRLPTPHPGESSFDYMNRVRTLCISWAAHAHAPGSLVFQIGNEPEVRADPDVPNPWSIDDWKAAWPSFARVVREAFPGIGLLSTPFSVLNTGHADAEYLSHAQGASVHCYWPADAPNLMTDPEWGGSWQQVSAFGVPVYITEANSNPTHAPQMANWAETLQMSGAVSGVAFYISDCPLGDPDHNYNITPSDMELVRTVIDAPPPPEPPSPDPVVDPTPVPVHSDGYTRDSQPMHTGVPFQRQQWLDFLSRSNPVEAGMIVGAIADTSAAIGYDGNLMAAQFAVETANGTSNRWRRSYNPAGIGITGDSVQDYYFAPVNATVQTRVAAGFQAMAALLNDYYGDADSPYDAVLGGAVGDDGNVHHFGFEAPLGKARLRDMDGVWAGNPEYSLAISEMANQVMGSPVIPEPQPPAPHQQYPMIYTVDESFPILQGSDGNYSHGGNSPGFYAIDYGTPVGTPIRAIADGTVEIIYWTDSNPWSLRTGHSIRITHITGYDTFSCHMSERYVEVGDTVKQGQIFGLTGDPRMPGNGYGTGPHLHWEIIDTATNLRVRFEDLDAQGLFGPYDPDAWVPQEGIVNGETFDRGELYSIVHGSMKPTATKKKAVNWNWDFGMEQAYEALANGTFKTEKQDLTGRSIVLGQALSKEEADPGTPGRSVRYFSNGKLTAHKIEEGGNVRYLIVTN